jgi:hypothetical protein
MTSPTAVVDRFGGNSPQQAQLLSLRFRALALSAVLIVLNNCATHPTPSTPDKLLSEEQIRALPHNEAMSVFLDTYKDQINSVFINVRDHAPPRYGQQLQRSKIGYSLEETPFSFYYNSANNNKTIHVCLGGINALDISATALAVSINIANDPEWWFKYMLYHRALRKRPGTVWLDPLHAAGVSQQNTPTEVAAKTALLAYSLLDDMLTFVIAHEAGHVALEHNGEQQAEEDRAAYLRRVRNQELEADSFALELVGSMDLNPSAVISTLLTHLVIFEDPKSLDIGKHPSDPQRIGRVADFYARREPGKASSSIENARAMASLFSSEESYKAFDDMASTITPESLQVWP